MKKSILLIATVITCLTLTQGSLFAHCQIPCGIYDDHARVQEMIEDVETIKKSVKMIAELSNKDDEQSKNQLTRWVMNKENHAQNVISTICNYFLTQRVKPSQEDYTERLKNHHAVIIASMKAKQNTDSKSVKLLEVSVGKIASYYPKANH